MRRGRLEAFSDGVLAIVITIMALELKVPSGHELADLAPMIPILISYVLSFMYVAIYWNNHHHIMHTVEHVSGRILWANMLLLFSLSLTPASTAWMGESNFASTPTIVYGVTLLANAVSYSILTWAITSTHGANSVLAHAVGKDWKARGSIVLYVLGTGLAFVAPLAGVACFATVAVIWLVPDRRIARELLAEKPR